MDSGDRDNAGRFNPGHRKVGGRRPGQTISAELRRLADPQAIAEFLLGVVTDPSVPMRERIEASKVILDRTEGKAVQRSLIARVSDRLLPAGYDQMTLDERDRVIDEIRARALRGDLSELVGVHDE